MTAVRPLAALVAATALLSTGCIEGLKIAEATLRLTAAVVEIGAAAAAASERSGACCDVRHDPTPTTGRVDRPMSECELARGRFREAHQHLDEVPPELRCLADGSYPRVSLPPAAVSEAPAAPAAEPAPLPAPDPCEEAPAAPSAKPAPLPAPDPYEEAPAAPSPATADDTI